MPARSLLARGAVAALTLAAITGGPAVAGGSGTGPGPCLNTQEAAFLKLINDYRAEHGAKPLAASKALDTASYLHSADMAKNDYFEHDSPDGQTPEDRMADQGYDADATGENIAAGYATAAKVFDVWRHSSGHNENMLDKEYRAIGIGLASDKDSEYDQYWTTDFGSVADAAPDCPAP